MSKRNSIDSKPLNFGSVPQSDVPQGRNGKHHQVISKIMSDLEQLEPGRALKIQLSKLPDSKENIRSALNRETRARGIGVSTASDQEFLYVWKSAKDQKDNTAV